MLAKIAPGANDFHAIARYLVRGKSGTPHPDRVAWTLSQNLPTDDPELAATYMAATASASPRTKNAAYHMMIAWHERERPSAELMQTIARQTLDLAGLAEHQALIMGHGDKPHRHLHILLNRVHPDTGRAWKTSHDFARFDRIMQQLAAEHGCEYTPAHAYNPDLTESMPKKPNSSATYAAKHGAPTTRLQWSKASARKFGEALSEELTPGSTWDDIEMALADHGLTLESKGKGLVAGNGGSYVKVSSLGLTVTAKGRARQLVPAYKPHHQTLFTVDEIDIVRALMTLGITDRDDLRNAIQNKKLDRARRRAGSSLAADVQSVLQQAINATSLKRPKPRKTRRMKYVQKFHRAPEEFNEKRPSIQKLDVL